MTDVNALRCHLKQIRKTMPPDRAAQNAQDAMVRLRRYLRLKNTNRVAGYIGHNGEIDPMPFLREIHAGSRIYLPVLHRLSAGRLWFCQWQPGDRLLANRFGIPEPTCRGGSRVPPRRLDIVITPLLGFDASCNRLGMGGGYYDRTFAFRNRLRNVTRPLMIGLAHEAQRVDSLDANPWDVRLDAVVTESRIYVACNHAAIAGLPDY
jgi:5-formyltetrahydrofolate cyclo-ligase